MIDDGFEFPKKVTKDTRQKKDIVALTLFKNQEVKDFELIFGESDGEIQSADIPVSWCVSPTYLQAMEKAGIKDPHIFITVRENHILSDILIKKLVPITQRMTYIPVNYASEYAVAAWIVDGSVGRKKIKMLLADDDRYNGIRSHSNEYLNEGAVIGNFSEGKSYGKVPYIMNTGDVRTAPIGFISRRVDEGYITSVAFTHDIINVPKEAFAPEPSEWMRDYINLWHKGKPKDQCEFRRRAIISTVGMKWVAMIAFMITKWSAQLTIGLILMLLGWTIDVNLKYFVTKSLRHPFISDFLDVSDDSASIMESASDMWKRHRYLIHWGDDTLKMGLLLTPVNLILMSSLLFVSVRFFVGFLIAELIVVIVFDTLTTLKKTLQDFDENNIVLFTKDMMYQFDMYITKRDLGSTVFFSTVAVILISCLIIVGYVVYVILMLGLLVEFLTWLSLFLILLVAVYYLYPNPKRNNEYVNQKEIFCTFDHENKVTPEVDKIPYKYRGIKLTFNGIKHKVCRPMQWR